ncbi:MULTISPECIES: lytic transglycosylase domain-containing protein [Acinetobacter]|jgi:soluble lytic murein transglycosylase|uniref:Lytic transglycosylase n=2 Tax=Acinetobacter TaxID=469 RepID=A0A242U492_ACIPI|nr:MULTISPECIES: lytic transglycosylase domain-containing protein [Acinetobacter]MBJ8435445.1 lytic transglycosylase domain-containing protein [Acinetobacter pittii]MBJ8502068.1 lytic transglycosylase domain-containing protein [Acinetobacter pittii]MBJ9892501.1 lytic transglycosylase domain-containing protein [Acinetobacter pittii]MCU4363161.1 lytic transglycosylase domain-containing protein [Acinetobacter sp. WU_MDCI_Abxc22]MCU4480488.1 lytic transglycosylase domain-containing protein [Acinet
MKNKYMHRSWLGAMCLLGCSFTYAAEEQFNDALNAANSGNTALLDQYQLAMQNDVLGYYPEYWKLNTNLGFQPTASIVSFAQRYPQSAMAEKLAADYVEEKVKQADFASAQPVLSYVTNPDQAENCALAQVRAKSGDALVFAEYKDVWLATESQPESCIGLGRMMLSSPLMSAQDKQQRLWVQLRSGLSGQALATAQTLGLNLSLAQLNQIQANPLNYLWSAPKTNDADYAYLIFALGRLANNDLSNAFSNVQRVAQGTPQNVQKYLYRTVAYIGGTTVMKNNFNREVLQYFDASYGYPLSPEEAEIYARQAIRFGAWESLIRAIDSMTVTQKQEDRWQYWLARASEQRGDSASKATAQQIYRKLAQAGDDYHNLLAKDRLGERYNHQPYDDQPTASDLRRLDQNIHFNRAFTLRRINANPTYTNREWNWAVRQAYLQHDDGLLLAAAKRAHDMGWYDRAIYAADRTTNKHNDTYRFVTPHKTNVVSHSYNAGIDPAWAYGLMRQESRFVTSARSHVGAGGLMQIMPDTAKLIARQMGETYNPAALSEMNTNIRYGTFYLSMIQGQLSNNPVLATAGYNAGPNRARRWQPDYQSISADQYTETIPLLETRDYVKHVMTNATHYGVILGQGAQSLSQRMKVIPMRTSP